MKTLTIQSFLFDRQKWTPAKAEKWLFKHGYATPPVDETMDFLRYRQIEPLQFQKGSFVTKVFSKTQGIKAIMARLKAPNKTQAKSGKRRTAPARSRAPKPNKKQKSLFPTTLVQLGICDGFEIEDGPEHDLLNWKHGLFSDPSGKKLFILPLNYSSKPITTRQKTISRKLYKRWTGFESDGDYTLKVTEGATLKTIGACHDILYTSDKWNKDYKKIHYIHTFKFLPTVSEIKKGKTTVGYMISGQKLAVKAEGITG